MALTHGAGGVRRLGSLLLPLLLLALSDAWQCAHAAKAVAVRNGQLEYAYISNAVSRSQRHWNFLGYMKYTGQARAVASMLSSTRTGATFLVPTDEAFLNLPASVKLTLATRPGKVRQLLAYHILTHQYLRRRLVQDLVGQGYITLQGGLLQKYQPDKRQRLRLGPQGAQTEQQLAVVDQPYLFADTVVAVYGISRVLIPPGF